MSNTAVIPAFQMDENELVGVLSTSLYPGAQPSSIKMVISYCKAAQLDPMQKPVHIVPMWDSKLRQMRDVILPGITLYRVQASRTGQCMGESEPEFGPDITEVIGGQSVTYPAWCKIVVKRRLPTGEIADFTAKEFWKENYAVKGGQEKSIAPNAMWTKRPYAQLAKCASSQALRKAFPELCASPTAEEMEGKTINPNEIALNDPPPRDEEFAQMVKDKLGSATDYADMKRIYKLLSETERAAVTKEECEEIRKQVEGKAVQDAEVIVAEEPANE